MLITNLDMDLNAYLAVPYYDIALKVLVYDNGKSDCGLTSVPKWERNGRQAPFTQPNCPGTQCDRLLSQNQLI